MKEGTFLEKIKKLNLTYHKNLDESIEIPIYFGMDKDGNVSVDTDGMRDEFELKLNDIWEMSIEKTDELKELVEEKLNESQKNKRENP